MMDEGRKEGRKEEEKERRRLVMLERSKVELA